MRQKRLLKKQPAKTDNKKLVYSALCIIISSSSPKLPPLTANDFGKSDSAVIPGVYRKLLPKSFITKLAQSLLRALPAHLLL